MDHSRIALLVHRYVQDACTPAELSELQEWRSGDPANEQLFQTLVEEGGAIGALTDYYSFDPNKLESRILTSVGTRASEPSIANRPVHRMHFLRAAWLRYAAAVIVIFGIGGYLWLHQDVHKGIVLTEHKKTKDTADILPGRNTATLVLGDESVIALDTAANGVLTRQGESEVIKTENGGIVYVGGRKAINTSGEVYYQKLITPRGGTYQVTLPDGTQVWLNAESSIRFPNVFTGDTRTVEVTGEAYFDVRADASKPFIVKTNTDEITVLGTRFNVHAYANEGGPKTSLVDGAVKVGEQVLKPGQAYQNGKIKPTNINSDVAWMKGMFAFADTDLESIMRQVSRWYNVDIIYQGKVPHTELTGEVSRALPLSKLLNGLSVYGIHSSIENKKVFISEK